MDDSIIGPSVVQGVHTTVDVIKLILQMLFAYIVAFVSLFVSKEPKSVKGEIVLITGAGHGIGKELALLYAKEGATVIIWDVNEANALKTEKEISDLGYSRAFAFQCDVSDRTAVLSLAAEMRNNIGDVTILINNAGIMPTHPLLDHSPEEIQRIMNVNVMAHFWTLEAFLPTMKKHNYGHIVALSSAAGIFGFENLVPYCAAKFAVKGMMEALHEELRVDQKNEIKITCVCPSMVNTGLCKRPRIRFPKLMPLLDPKEVAKAIVDAQRRDLSVITLPRYVYWANAFGRTLPIRAQMHLIDFTGVGLHSDL